MSVQDVKTPSFIPYDELVIRERMRVDLDESGHFAITEVYRRIAPKLSMRTLRRIKKELWKEYLALRYE